MEVKDDTINQSADTGEKSGYRTLIRLLSVSFLMQDINVYNKSFIFKGMMNRSKNKFRGKFASAF